MNSSFKENTKTVLICIIVLFGSAFAIMSFNEDVGVGDLFQKIYKLVEGREHTGFGILELTYGIGIAIGITVFLIVLIKRRKIVSLLR